MSLMKTFARVAAGVMIAKGIGAVMQNQRGGASAGQPRPAGTGQGGLLDDLLRSNVEPGQGSLRDRLGEVLGGKPAQPGSGRPYGGPNSAGAQGGLGGLLDELTGMARGGSGGGGLGDILGQLSGGAKTGATGGSGGLGDLLGGLLGGAAGGAAAGSLARKGAQDANDASFGELFNDAITRDDEPQVAPTVEQNAVAGLMLKAMIQAAKADGRIDDAEKQHLLGQFGDTLDDEERQFIREQMAAPVDAAALARQVPKGLESQIYLMSLMAIDFDNEQEARYLNDLAGALGLSQQAVNLVHDRLGARPLYA